MSDLVYIGIGTWFFIIHCSSLGLDLGVGVIRLGTIDLLVMICRGLRSYRRNFTLQADRQANGVQSMKTHAPMPMSRQDVA